jgi:transposase
MPRAYSEDLRQRVVCAVIEEGMSASAAAHRFGVGRSTAIIWLQRFRREGTVAPSPMGRPKGMKVARYKEFILAKMKNRDTTLDDLQAALWEEYGMYASRTLLHRFVRDTGLSFKKNRTRQRTGQAGRGTGAVAVAPGPSRS